MPASMSNDQAGRVRASARLRYSVVFFDFGGTLTHRLGGQRQPDPVWLGRALGDFLKDHGRSAPPPQELADKALSIRHSLRQSGQTIGSQLSRTKADANIAKWFHALCSALRVEPLSGTEAKDMIAAYRHAEMRSTPGVNSANRSVLQKLKRMGCRLGVISNVDGYLRQRLSIEGVLGEFEVVVESANVGVLKPAPEIFLCALRSMCVHAADAVHVGDSYEADVIGARGVGMACAWLGKPADVAPGRPHPDHFIKSLNDLLDIIRF